MRRQMWLVAGLCVAAAGAVVGEAGVVGAQEDVEEGDVVSVEAAPELLDAVSAALLAEGWYVEDGAGVPAATLGDVRAAMLDAGSEWGLVALTTPPPKGTRNFATNLLAEVRSSRSRIDTVVVLTFEDVAGASRAASDDEVDAALAAAIPVLERDVVGGWAVVYEQLTGVALPPVAADGEGARVPVWAVGAGGLVAGSVAAAAAAVATRRSRSAPSLAGRSG